MPVQISAEEIAASLTPHRLHLIVMPTEACNFRCVYCYESFRYKRMAQDVVNGLERWIEASMPRLHALVLSWFGGEPLLALDLIERVMKRVRVLRDDYSGVGLASDVTTNAYLLDQAVFLKLLDLGVRSFQISLDGPREIHDRMRVLAGGKGTFDRIWNHLVATRAVEGRFRVLVRVHVTRENRDHLPAFLDRYTETFGADPRYEIFIRPLSRLGGPHDSTLPVLEGREAEQTVQQLRATARQKGLRLGAVETGTPICYAATANSFVVRSNGRINKCTVALEHPNNQVGVLQPDGRVQIDSPKVLAWMRGFRSGSGEALACPMVGLADRTARAQNNGSTSIRLAPPPKRIFPALAPMGISSPRSQERGVGVL